MVTMVFATSFLSLFEPAPCDMFFLLALLFSLGSGLRISLALMPLLLILLLYNVSGLISWTVVPVDILRGQDFLIGLAYTSFSAIYFAAYVAEDPVPRYWQMIKAYWVAATIGAALGLLRYYDIEPFLSILPGFDGRAVGAYKDPNVYSTWLVPAFISLMHAIMLKQVRLGLISASSLLLILAALFLAFSRGAWLNVIVAAVFVIGFTYALSPSNKLRGRIIVAGVLGVSLLALLLFVLLSIPATRDVFLDRFTLTKSYDAGETGRFGNQLNSIPMLIERPLGFGPYQFEKIFGLAPHNTFLNAFAAAGWLGGISFIVFIISTMIVGFRTMFARTPFQPMSIVVFGCFVAVTIQAIQIDMEHWRHLYWIVGIIWGFFAASIPYQFDPPTVEDYFDGWNLDPPTIGRTQSR
jgi:O-antigen ligase